MAFNQLLVLFLVAELVVFLETALVQVGLVAAVTNVIIRHDLPLESTIECVAAFAFLVDLQVLLEV